MGQGRVWKVVIGMKKGGRERERERGVGRWGRGEDVAKRERERERERPLDIKNVSCGNLTT